MIVKILIESELRNYKLLSDIRILRLLWKEYRAYVAKNGYGDSFAPMYFANEMNEYLGGRVDKPIIELFREILKKGRNLEGRPIYIHVVYSDHIYFSKKRSDWIEFENIDYVFCPKEVITRREIFEFKTNKRLRYAGVSYGKSSHQRLENAEPKSEEIILATYKIQ
jgi:hypothetical protein